MSLGWSPSERGLPGVLAWWVSEDRAVYEEELLEDLPSDLEGDTLVP